MNESSDQLLYLGHASLRLQTADGHLIYIDPYAGSETDYALSADLILVTHGHYDHNDLAKVARRNPDCQIITWVEALANGEHQTFDLGYLRIRAVEAGYNPNHDPKNCVGYILTFPTGVKLYVAGDTSETPQMPSLAAEQIDYAFYPCDGVFNMDAKAAALAAAKVQARQNIPYHTKPGALFDRQIAEQFDAPNHLIIEPGETISLTPPAV